MVKKRGFVLFGGILFALLLLNFLAADVNTSVNVPSTGPLFSGVIPNQTWAANTILPNAFNLNDYFRDANGIIITYSPSSVPDIDVIISSNGSVSFSPHSDFNGTETVTFTATDIYGSSLSNPVSLTVVLDKTSPQWGTPSKNPKIVYQNTFVNFSTPWTDNFQLRDFTFSINQGTEWKNYTGTFRGVFNVSKYTVQISAAENKSVLWYFCASDTSSNSNCTAVQNFTVSPQPPPSEQNIGPENNSYQNFSLPTPATQEVFNFTVSPEYFKVSLKQGSTVTRLLQISNIGTAKLVFGLGLDSEISDIVRLSDNSFTLDLGESKSITVDFTATNFTSVGQYFGSILVNSSSSPIPKAVPVIVDVNPRYLNFKIAVNVTEPGKRIKPGQVVRANITIQNLQDLPESNITLYYSIKDLLGTSYNFSEENLTLGNLVKIQRGLMMPSNVGPGTYIFYARANYGNFVTLDSDTFEIGSGFDFAAFFKYSSIVIAIFILSAFSMILFLKYKRTKTKERLLSLYLMLSELKKLVKENKTEEAIDLYVRIKSFYGEPVSRTELQNKEKLKEEINALSKRLQNEVANSSAEVKEAVADNSNAEKKEGESEVKPEAPAAPAASPAPESTEKPASNPAETKPKKKKASKSKSNKRKKKGK